MLSDIGKLQLLSVCITLRRQEKLPYRAQQKLLLFLLFPVHDASKPVKTRTRVRGRIPLNFTVLITTLAINSHT